VSRVKPNPYLTEPPLFIDIREPTAETKKSSARKSTEVRTSRIQHEDPIVEALISLKLNDLGSIGPQKSHAWQGPKARLLSQEEEETVSSYGADTTVLQSPIRSSSINGTSAGNPMTNSESTRTTFDICLPKGTGKAKHVVLSPSVLMQKELQRKKDFTGTNEDNKQPNRVLLPGMILLKRWLSPEEQVHHLLR
jgi:hypothetical protein